MKTAVVIFVKTPGFSPIKTRLAKDIGKKQAELFYLSAIKCLEQKLLGLSAEMFRPIWAVAESEAATERLWRQFPVVVQSEGDLGQRLFSIQKKILASYDSYVFIGADAPHIDLNCIERACSLLKSRGEAQLALAFDGGYYLFASAKEVEASVWLNTPYSVKETGETFAHLLRASGHQVNTDYPVLRDVDCGADLRQLMSQLHKMNSPELEFFKGFAKLNL